MALPVPEPLITPDTAPFWEAAAQKRLVLQWCSGCQEFIWYPRTLCPGCMSTELEWVEASGRGTTYSFSVVRVPGTAEYAPVVPYILAYVKLEEGPVLLTNLVNCSPEEAEVGQAVRVVFEPAGDSAALVRFTPTRSSEG
jgi:uncharacterized OB-fold protein